MVCLVTPVAGNSNCKMDRPAENMCEDENTADENEDDRLKIRRMAGGSIIAHKPIFSPDGELLFVIFKTLIQVYSTLTGEWVRDLEGSSKEIVAFQYELGKNSILVGLTRSGELIRWNWRSGAVESKTRLKIKASEFYSLHFLALESGEPTVFVTYAVEGSLTPQFDSFYLMSGEKNNVVHKLQLLHEHTLQLKNCKVKPGLVHGNGYKLDVDNINFHFIAVACGPMLMVYYYRTNVTNSRMNAYHKTLTAVRVHPREEMVATGDEMGRIFLWRELDSRSAPSNELYHWHHTQVTSIEFTMSGTGFYSGGLEGVLVKWSMNRPDLRAFLPRLPAMIRYIAVAPKNTIISVSTDDNGIQIVDTQNDVKFMLQGLTCIFDDKTGLDKFPMGLKLHPRTNALALNGRVGHIQFYSTYTKGLLYNVDIVMENQLSIERNKALYNIRVVAAAFNIDWMATVEEWNDQEHFPEVRLKFWHFNKKTQNYTLNTNFEGPHGGSIRGIEFSNSLDSEDLLCATAGCDNYIKIWALEDPDNIYRKQKVWFSIARTTYKDYDLQCISFSQDGSLLTAGFRDTLCIYKSDTLALKVALTAPSRYTGALDRVEINLPYKNDKTEPCKSTEKKNAIQENQRQTFKLFNNFFENNDETLIHELRQEAVSPKQSKKEDKERPLKPEDLDVEQKKMIFGKIQSLAELSLFQKLQVFRKLGIFCSVPKEYRWRMKKYVTKNILEKEGLESNLNSQVRNLSSRYRFKAKYRLYKYMNRKSRSRVDQQLIPIMSLLNLEDSSNTNYTKGVKTEVNEPSHYNGGAESHAEEKSDQLISSSDRIPHVAHIKYVAFAAAEYAHLIIACTAHHVHIWDILTLRIKTVLRLSVHRMTVDPITSLVAFFTINDELYVFPPNAPMPLYNRLNLPTIHDAVWVPRRYPKSHSLNLDWQAVSTLFFLSGDQELLYLTDEKNDEAAVSTAFVNEAQDIVKYSTFGTFALRQATERAESSSKSSVAIGVPGKHAVKSLIEMSTHTMAPVHLLCPDFIDSFLQVQADQQVPSNTTANQDQSKSNELIEVSDTDESDTETTYRQNRNKSLSELEGNNQPQNIDKTQEILQRDKLKRILKDSIDISF